ncbi:translocase of outer mitochondrial membrane 20 isoform X2 [Takifugu rubripes]|uniref:translocase of outer mitochondrial membrane 20 isoform X2 n=1 Tax=Takifugu rubripes TaxID=31033 RepID=UPI00114574AA|nr:mitochondrial import receptor subunit TOM20 homolog isoform X2 [Takifugu rubripes]
MTPHLALSSREARLETKETDRRPRGPVRSEKAARLHLSLCCRDHFAASSLQLPDLKDPEAVQRFFLQEIQLGEEHLAAGELETGVDHLTNAIAVCEQPQKLLQVLQQTLPPPVFQMMLSRLPAVGQRIASSRWLTEEDVE